MKTEFLVNKHYWNEDKTKSKIVASLLIFHYLCKRFRSFNTVIIGSVDWTALKLPAVKVEGLKKKSAIWPWPLSNQSARVWLRPGSNLSQSLTDSNFAALWPKDPIFSVLDDLILISKFVTSSRDWKHFKGGFCPLKVTSFCM